ncbi:peptide MFS transporter [Phenylobacterium sp.]|uniref:peptide MFS transporter n=1 Tax=Phenylobacterium sp. TaxID=1871053 RepID=UPI002C05757D|nr:peptide MFS transporter [Phenylobacterium sp.]HLZ75805.1 peptide MFS transporter [Phenylobacterium sp.]
MAVAGDLAIARGDRRAFGHPTGLIPLAGTELWERISFHGMLALLTLYLAEQLLLPGHVEKVVGFPAFRAVIEGVTGPLSVQALASQIFGLYIGFIYFTPIFGGFIGDRVIGRKNAVILGAVLMTCGHLAMAFDQSFLLALLLLILGAGFLRGNLIAQVGKLYTSGDPRLASGLQIYVAMVNTGGFIAPIITGLLGQTWGWHFGFGFAGFGMLIGLVTYLAGSKHIPADPPRHEVRATAPLTGAEWRTVGFLIALLPPLTLYWIVNSQEWNVYNIWTRDHVNMVVGGFHMPIAWIQSLGSIICVALVPLVLALWDWQQRNGREFSNMGKMAFGCAVMAAFTLLDGAASLIFGASAKIPLIWVIVDNFGESFGYLWVVPVAIAFYTHTAPKKVNAMMVGVYYLAIFAGSLISGRLGGLYETLSPTAFWALHAGVVAAAGAIFGGLALSGVAGRFAPEAA